MAGKKLGRSEAVSRKGSGIPSGANGAPGAGSNRSAPLGNGSSAGAAVLPEVTIGATHKLDEIIGASEGDPMWQDLEEAIRENRERDLS